MCARGPAPTPSVKKLIPIPMYSPRSRFSACSRRSSPYPAMSIARASARG